MEFNQFYLLTESVQPQKPSGHIKSSWITKQKGTAFAHKVKQFQYQTKLGNDVKVHADPIENGYSIIFYVNDKLDDRSSEENKGENNRDDEILNGVLWIVKNKLSDAQILEFDAWGMGSGDSKIIKGLDVHKPLKAMSDSFKNVEYQIEKITPIEIPPTPRRIELARKFGLRLNQEFDIEKDMMLALFRNLRNAIQEHDLPVIYQQIDAFKNIVEKSDALKKRVSGVEELLKHMLEYRDALISNTETGLVKNRNRRKGLYAKIMERYFSDEYTIDVAGNHFTLVKK